MNESYLLLYNCYLKYLSNFNIMIIIYKFDFWPPLIFKTCLI